VSCHDLKKGQVLVCEECGLELKVKKACDCDEDETGACTEGGFSCCGGPMKVK
jgi:hypothetical protein